LYAKAILGFTMDLASSIQFKEQWMLASSNQGEIVTTSDLGAWIWWSKCMWSCEIDEYLMKICWWSSLWSVSSRVIMKISKLEDCIVFIDYMTW